MKYGRYKVQKELGKGAMGVVYKAHDPHIDRMVALKVLRPDRVTSEALVKRFLNEAKAIGRFSHPNIVTVYDVGRDHGTVFIAEEFLEGTPLDEFLKENRLETEKIVEFGIQVADALDFAHQKGIIHRDIKPSNIIFTREGQIKITDFGIAHIEDENAPQLTQAGEILGTPYYMSPEQLQGRDIDGRSDLFSLGVMLYELAAKKRPFTGKNLPSIFTAITQKVPAPPHEIDADLPAQLSDVILKSLEKNPDDRYATGRQFAEALKAIDLTKQPVPEQREEIKEEIEENDSWFRSKAAIAVVIVLLLAGGGYYYFSTRHIDNGNTAVVTPDKPVPGPVVEPDIPPKPSLPPEKPVEPVEIPPEKPPEKPPAELAMLNLETEPEGAKVFIDGELKGETPLDLKVPFGKYEMRVSKENFYEWAGQVELEEEGPTPLFIKLNPLIF